MDWKASLEALKNGMESAPEVPDGMEVDGHTESESNGKQKCSCAETARLDIVLDKKGRKGKAATIVCGFTIADGEIENVARRLKQKLGAGGSCRGGEILIQGDKRKEVSAALSEMGFKNRLI